MNTAYVWALVGLTITLVGLAFAAFGVRDAWRNYRSAEIMNGGLPKILWVVTKGNLRTEVLCFLAQGFVALVLAVVLWTEGSTFVRQMTVRLGVTSVTVLLTLKGICDRQDRKQIARIQDDILIRKPPE